MIEVGHERAKLPARALGTADFQRQCLFQPAAVANAGERIGQ
jgi:hypothetical protein